jgi:hypothetical protein
MFFLPSFAMSVQTTINPQIKPLFSLFKSEPQTPGIKTSIKIKNHNSRDLPKISSLGFLSKLNDVKIYQKLPIHHSVYINQRRKYKGKLLIWIKKNLHKLKKKLLKQLLSELLKNIWWKLYCMHGF